MAARNSTRAKKRKPPQERIRLAQACERLGTVIAVAQTIISALTDYEDCEPLGVTLLECGVYPLIAIRDELEKLAGVTRG